MNSKLRVSAYGCVLVLSCGSRLNENGAPEPDAGVVSSSPDGERGTVATGSPDASGGPGAPDVSGNAADATQDLLNTDGSAGLGDEHTTNSDGAPISPDSGATVHGREAGEGVRNADSGAIEDAHDSGDGHRARDPYGDDAADAQGEPINDPSHLVSCPSVADACRSCLSNQCVKGYGECSYSLACTEYLGAYLSCDNDGHKLPGELVLCLTAECGSTCFARLVNGG